MSDFSINHIKDLLNEVFVGTDYRICSVDVSRDKNNIIRITYVFSNSLSLPECEIIKNTLDEFVSSQFKLNHKPSFNNLGNC